MRPLDAIIVAGGSGARFGAKKQFLDLCGRPVLAHAARSFLDHPAVGRVVVVVPPDDMGAAEALFGAEAPRLVVAEGGASRCESVARGLAHASPGGTVLIHDGVRPFVTRPLIDRVLGGLEGAHGSIPALAVTDTLKEAHGEFVVRTVPRAGLYHVQTPQAFPTDLVRDAHTRAARDGLDVTDDSALMETLGYRVRVVEGDPFNIKITYPSDMTLAEAILGCRTASA